MVINTDCMDVSRKTTSLSEVMTFRAPSSGHLQYMSKSPPPLL